VVQSSLDASQPAVNDIDTVQKLIASGKYEGVQLGQLYFQLGYLFHHAWLHKLRTGHQNLLIEADTALEAALNILKGGPQLIPITVEILSMRGIVLKMLGKATEAMKCYDLALSYPLHDVDRASLFHCKGDTYFMNDNYPAALAEYEAALSLAPCKTERYYSYANALKTQNHVGNQQWKELYDRLLSIEMECHGKNPKYVKKQKSNKKKQTVAAFDTDFEDLFPDNEDEDLYSDEELSKVLKRKHTPEKPYLFPDEATGYMPSKRSDLYYAIYIVADKLGEKSSAWQYLQRANEEELSQREMTFDAAQSIVMKNTTVNVFTDAFVKSFPSLLDYEDLLLDYSVKYANPLVSKFRRAKLKNKKVSKSTREDNSVERTRNYRTSNVLSLSEDSDADVQPIFIVGMMRSGSTLLETILDTHPNIWGMGEDSVFNSNLTSLRDALAAAPGVQVLSRGEHSHAVERHLASILAEYHVLTVQEMQRVAIEVVVSQQPSQLKNEQELSVSGENSFAMKPLSYVKDIANLRYIVDKMLFNYRNIGFIHMVFPEAPIIHMIRDPLDTLLSCYRLKFDDIGLHWTLKIPDLVLQYVMYLETVHHFRTVLPNRILDIRYEDLVLNPAPVLKKVFSRMPSLEYDVDQLLRFHESKRAVHTHSQTQVKQQLYSHSIGNWRRYAAELQPMIEEFQKYLPYLESIGALPFRNQINWDMRIDFPYQNDKEKGEVSSIDISNTKLGAIKL
jgi:tetratricopeptide (TPR) repeat protein